MFQGFTGHVVLSPRTQVDTHTHTQTHTHTHTHEHTYTKRHAQFGHTYTNTIVKLNHDLKLMCIDFALLMMFGHPLPGLLPTRTIPYQDDSPLGQLLTRTIPH